MNNVVLIFETISIKNQDYLDSFMRLLDSNISNRYLIFKQYLTLSEILKCTLKTKLSLYQL